MYPTIKEFHENRTVSTVEKNIDTLLPYKNDFLKVLDKYAHSYYTDPQVKALTQDLKINSKENELYDKLINCKKGKKNWFEYQQLSITILNHLFNPPLLKAKPSETEGRKQRRDIIMHIPPNIDGFWRMITNRHNATAIIFDCKNYARKIKDKQVDTTNSYLGKKKLGTFAIILTRKGGDSGAIDSCRNYWLNDTEHLILILSDDDILSLLKLKQNNELPSVHLDSLIRHFLEKQN